MQVEAAQTVERQAGAIVAAGVAMPVAPACFSAPGASIRWVAPLAVHLDDRHAEALAELLPMLLCGEESAALVFDHYAKTASLTAATRRALECIGADEARHAIWLQGLRLGLPAPSMNACDERAVRRFYLSLGERDPARHLLRIAALDSAVCVLLGMLRRRGCPVARDPGVAGLVSRIHLDESRHAVMASGLARQLAVDGDRRDVAVDTRARLTRLLSRRADALERLEVCPDSLFRRLNRVPRVLFA